MSKAGRFSAVPNAAVDDERLTAIHLALLVVLGRYTDAHGWCFPSQNTLANHCRTTRQTVNRTLKELEDCGYLESRRRKKENGSEISKEYRVIFDTTPCRLTRHPLSPDATPPVITDDTPCRLTRHKQEPDEQEPDEQIVSAGARGVNDIHTTGSKTAGVGIEGEQKTTEARLSDGVNVIHPSEVQTDWQEFTASYPTQNYSFRKAYAHYYQARAAGTAHSEIMEGVARYADWLRCQRIEGRFIQTPARWLEDEGWKVPYENDKGKGKVAQMIEKMRKDYGFTSSV